MYIVIIIIVGLFLWFISRQTIKGPIEIEAKSLLRFNAIFGVLGIVCMGLGLFMPFYSYIINDSSTEETLIMPGLLIFFFGMGYWVFSWYHNHKVLFDDNEITVIDSNRKEKRFQWSDI
jgi:hypothetical protein